MAAENQRSQVKRIKPDVKIAIAKAQASKIP
jgi:hypothetical protein